ncbi:MAG TPA: MG2 domain-containing protein [bacterium]|nr:MG2 domain-containing protein [bacterium]
MKGWSLVFLMLALTGVTLAGDLQVQSVTPKGPVGAVTDALSIVVTFSEPMVPLKATPEGLASGPLRISPAVKGKYRWMGTRTLVFTPLDTLPTATRFEMTIPAGTKALSGAVLKAPYVWSFETLRPVLLYTAPESGEGGFDPRASFFLCFNLEMDPATVSGRISLSDGARTVPLRFRHATFEELHRHWRLGDDSSRVIAATPAAPLARNKNYTLKLQPGLTAKMGALGLAEERTITFVTIGDLVYRGFSSGSGDAPKVITPVSGIQFNFSNRVAPAELIKHLKFQPEVAIPDYYAERTWGVGELRLNLDFLPETRYRFTIDGELQDVYGSRIRSAVTDSFRTAAYPARVSMNTGPGVLEAYGDRSYPVFFVNKEKVKLRLGLVAPERLIPLLLSTDDLYGRAKPLPDSLFMIDRIWEIKQARNVKAAQPLKVDWLLGGRKTGVVLSELDDLSTDPEIPVRYNRILLQVTDLGVSAKFSPLNNLVWVTNLKDAAPVAGARVEIRDDRNKVLWSGVTGPQGLCETPGWRELGIASSNRWEKPRQWVFVYKDQDFAYNASDWGTGIFPYRFGIEYEWNPEPVKYAGLLFTERGLYRAGETVHLKGMLREKRFHDWAPPGKKSYLFRLSDSRGNEMVNQQITLSEFGSFDHDLKLPESAPLGYYYANLSDPPDSSGMEGESYMYTSFRVEAYRPAEFSVRVRAAAPSFLLGDSAAAFVSANYLFGAPLAGQKVAWNAYLDRDVFQPEGFEGFQFGVPEWYEEETERFSGRVLSQSRALLDEQGGARFAAPVLAAGVDFPLSLTVSADVTSPGRQVIGASEKIIIHPASYYIGLKPSTSFAEAMKPLLFELTTVTPEGAAAPGKSLKVRLVKRQWHSVRKAGSGGRYEWLSKAVDTPIDSFAVTTGAAAVTKSFTPREAGVYFLEAVGREAGGRTTRTEAYLYVTGKGYVAWEREDDDRIELVADRSGYKPGQTARVMVKSPFESARALVTLEREGVMSQQVLTLTGSTPTIEVPLTHKHLPNVFMSVILLRGRSSDHLYSEEGEDLGRPAFKIGYVNLPVDPGNRHLKVAVKPDKSDYLPGESVTLDIDVRDAAGEPSAAEVTLAVVDRGVLNLINYELPDPFDIFYGQRPLSVQSSETRLHVVEQRNYVEKGEKRGGGGAEGFGSSADLRKNFKATAYWNPALDVDASGRAKVTFKLPDNLTTFKIMVVANSIASEFGYGSSELKVNQPVMLLASLPRFARIGDLFEAGAVIHNYSGRSGEATLNLQVSGLELQGPASATVTVPQGGSREVRFKFKAVQEGKAIFQFRCQMGGFSDGLERTIPVQTPGVRESVALYQRADGPAQQSLEIPQEAWKELSTLELTLASTALSELSGPFEYLAYYPYECLEQRLSRALPVLVSGDLVEAFGLQVKGVRDYRTIVQGVLADLGRFRTDEGGFALWQGSNYSSPYVTAYAAWAVTLAKRAGGYEVDETLFEEALAYMKNLIDGQFYGASPYDETSWQTTRALMLYVLALNGQADAGALDRLISAKAPMTVTGQAWLLKTVNHLKRKDGSAAKLSQALLNKIRVTPTEVHFTSENNSPWIYDSDVRTTAVVLQALLETGAAFPQAEQAVEWLMTERRQGRWSNTQENFFVLYALSEYFRKYETETPQFTARVRLAGREVMSKLFSGRTAGVERRVISLTDYQEKKVQAEIAKEGPGTLYYGLRMNYYPREYDDAREEGITLVKVMEPLTSGRSAGEKIPAGEVVKVTLTVIVPQARHYVVVDDPLPAGMEAVNATFATTSAATAMLGEGEESEEAWWYGFTHIEKRDDRVLLFADWLPEGAHSYSYLMRATTPGTFTLPPARAEEMYKPEVYGRTTGGELRIE